MERQVNTLQSDTITITDFTELHNHNHKHRLYSHKITITDFTKWHNHNHSHRHYRVTKSQPQTWQSDTITNTDFTEWHNHNHRRSFCNTWALQKRNRQTNNQQLGLHTQPTYHLKNCSPLIPRLCQSFVKRSRLVESEEAETRQLWSLIYGVL